MAVMLVHLLLVFLCLKLQNCQPNVDDELRKELNLLTEKINQLSNSHKSQYAELRRENKILKIRVEKLEKENRDMQDFLTSRDNPVLDKNNGYRLQLLDRNDNHTNLNDANHEKTSFQQDAHLQVPDDAKVSTSPMDQVNKRERLRSMPQPTSTKVAFSATISSSVSLGQHQTVEFDKVYTNYGNGYDARHGHFTAPVKAMYLFSFSVMNLPNQKANLAIVKNGEILAEIYAQSNDYNMGTQVVVTALDVGDMVWVRHDKDDTSSETVYERYTYFTGTILFEIE